MRSHKRWGSGAFALILTAAFAVEAADPYFQTERFAGAGTCADCHDGLYDELGQDVSIQREWSGTMMGNSSRDPFWRAKFASEIRRNPHLETALNAKCTRCHTPMASEEVGDVPGNMLFFGQGFSNPNNPYHDAAMDGVSCTLCHQIVDDGSLGTLEGASGNFAIADDRVAFGPFTGPRTNPMQRQSGYTPRHSPLTSDSKLCSACHNLTTPVFDSGGNIVSTTPDTEFPEQMVYTEWEHSVFAGDGVEASTCQTCHMARADGVQIANRPRDLTRRDDFGRHGFYGGNTLVLDILDANRDLLDVGDGDFDASIQATRETLRSAAEVLIEQAVLEGDELTVQVRVVNHSGHKLPTSFPSRRAYLHLTVTDGVGNTLFESGRLNPDGGIEGVDSDSGEMGYEPHYEEISSPEQVQVYEPIMGDSGGNQTYTLLNAAAYIKDNRIPPRGFDKHAVPDQIAVKGLAVDDADFGDGSDLVMYRIKLPAVDGVSVSVELNYQTLAYGFLRDLRQDAEDPVVAGFLDMYDGSKVRVETIAEASETIGQVDIPSGTAPGTGSGTDGGTDGSQTGGSGTTVGSGSGGGFGRGGGGRR